MLTFLFWNLNKKPLDGLVFSLAKRYRVDVLMLAECTTPVSVMLRGLNQERSDYQFPFSECQNIAVYTRFAARFLKPISEGSRFSLRRLILPVRDEILLGVVHLSSKREQSGVSQSLRASRFGGRVRDVERRLGHARTILVGDFNMNPFEPAVVATDGLHAVMTRELAERGTRTVDAEEYPFFYNPMWGHFGDGTRGPPGTYYYARSEPVVYFWNVFDQVLLRPDLLPAFRNEDLEILASDGATSFLTKRGLPDKGAASDHLPILFRIRP